MAVVIPPGGTTLPPCLNCQAHIDYADDLLGEIQQLTYRLNRAERENYRLRTAGQDSASKQNSKLYEQTKEFLTLWHDLRRKHFRDNRRLITDPEGTRGKLYQKKRKLWSHEDLILCLRGVELSDFHVSDKRYFEPSSFLRDDERIAKHIERCEAYDKLVDAGFKNEAFNRSAVQKVQYSAPDPDPLPWVCSGCGSPGICRCDQDRERRLAA